MDQPLHLLFPSDLLTTKFLLLQEGGKLVPSLIKINVHNTHHTDLIYTSASLFCHSWEKEWCVNEELVYCRWSFDWLCLIKQSKAVKCVCCCLLCPVRDPRAPWLSSWTVEQGQEHRALCASCTSPCAKGLSLTTPAL